MQPHISIMLIDDDEDDRDMFFQALMIVDQSSKYLEFDNGADAIKLLKDSEVHLPDIIFLDFNMPLMNGFECLKDIRKIDALKQTPVILYTTALHLKNYNYAVYNPVHFISKPLKFEDIVQSIKRVINNVTFYNEGTSE